MEITCGVLVTNGKRLLIGKLRKYKKWDIPKGTMIKGESYAKTAARELYEETGIKVKPNDLIEIGEFEYIRKKRIFLFVYYVKQFPSLSRLKCTIEKGEIEMNQYKYVKISEMQNFLSFRLNHVLQGLKDIMTVYCIENQ